ncbi:unnamed protein product [Lupinus luteus]|uniref:Uncharacterized protein n=1 Tax=Lupinus luteus TaxID=3873 RepID=A0AAV1YEX2_LUPLU
MANDDASHTLADKAFAVCYANAASGTVVASLSICFTTHSRGWHLKSKREQQKQNQEMMTPLEGKIIRQL